MSGAKDELEMTIKAEILKKQDDYSQAKIHSEKIDRLLDFRCVEIERELAHNLNIQTHNLWKGLDIQSLQTPYSEIVEMIQILNPNPAENWIDLGAAYGRLGIVLGLLRPDIVFKGYEYVSERANEANRVYEKLNLKYPNVITQNIADKNFDLPQADLYFIYDFGSREDVYIVLEKIRKIAKKQSVKIVARGRGIRSWIFMDFPWLSAINQPQSYLNWTLFRS